MNRIVICTRSVSDDRSVRGQRINRDIGRCSRRRPRTLTFVILAADPTADIGSVRRIHAVVVRGRMFDRAALDRLLEAAARAAADN